MIKRQVLIGATFLVGCVAGGVSSHMIAPPARAGAPVPRWEHYCAEADNEAPEVTRTLNGVGAQGWELSAATTMRTGVGETVLLCLKRPLP
jgi:hypothetical protein